MRENSVVYTVITHEKKKNNIIIFEFPLNF